MLEYIFKSRIDRLEEKQQRLVASIEAKKSNIAYVNSDLERKIKKWEEKAYKNRKALEKFIENVNANIEKNAKLITAEAEYAAKLGKKYTTKTKTNGAKNGK